MESHAQGGVAFAASTATGFGRATPNQGVPRSARFAMEMLMIVCPIAHRAVPTGVTVEPSNFECLLDVPRTLACSHCGGLHVWRKREAWLSDPGICTFEPELMSVCRKAGRARLKALELKPELPNAFDPIES
jgi:hypothetical protein